MPSFCIKLRIIWIAILLVAVFVFILLAVVPSGKITYSTDFKGYNDFIGELTPADRVERENGARKIIGDPAYFSLRLPRRFEDAKLTIKYKPDENFPVIEAGILKDKRTWQYDLRPLYNGKLEALLNSWNILREPTPSPSGAEPPLPKGEYTILLQREKKFASIKDFLKNPPEAGKIALYNYDLRTDFILPGYEPARATTTLCRPLQGTYQFYTYIKNENLAFDFLLEDLNKNSDLDPVDVFVYYEDKQIFTDSLGDDGIADDSGAEKPWRHLKINLANLPEGAYKIGLRANDDIVTRTIMTPQSKMAFVNKITLAPAPEVSCGRNLFTDSRQAQFTTLFSDRLGEIKIKEAFGAAFLETVVLKEAFKQYSTGQVLPDFSEIIMPADGISVSGDGLFSMSPEQFFNPGLKKVDANFDADREGVDFILANYAPPVREGEWLVSEVEFDLETAYKEKSRHSFLISVPGLRAEDNAGAGVTVGEIKIELAGTSLWGKIKKMLKAK
jgi:hypothetical protein